MIGPLFCCRRLATIQQRASPNVCTRWDYSLATSGSLANSLSPTVKTQQHLADAMAVHRNAMVGLVDDLEHRGLVERKPNSSDRRAHSVRLTALGRKVLPRAQKAADELETELTGGLDTADRRQLIALLHQVAKDAGLQPGSHPGLKMKRESRR